MRKLTYIHTVSQYYKPLFLSVAVSVVANYNLDSGNVELKGERFKGNVIHLETLQTKICRDAVGRMLLNYSTTYPLFAMVV